MKITVNGKEQSVEVDPSMPLLWVLRDELKLTGTKFGCGIAQCGACTVHLDGAPIRSCITPVSAVTGKSISTIDAVEGRVAEAVQQAWIDNDVPQCGYCQSGQVMSAVALLEGNSSPSDEDIDTALSGNVCRCATYNKIRKAIHAAADSLGKGEVS